MVNIDPFAEQAGAWGSRVALGVPPGFEAGGLLTGERFSWRAARNSVQLGPGQAHVLKVIGV